MTDRQRDILICWDLHLNEEDDRSTEYLLAVVMQECHCEDVSEVTEALAAREGISLE